MATMAPGQLFDPKTFTAEQAAMLNNVPGQSLSQSNTAAQILAAQKLSPNIDVNDTKSATPLSITNPDLNLKAEGASLNTYADYLKLLQSGEESEAMKDADALRDEVGALLPQTGGRGAAQLKAEEEVGVGTLKNELADVNAQILARTAQYNQLVTNLEGKPITMDSIIGGTAQARKAQASEIGLLQAIALGKQGMLTAAQDAADRAVDLAYDDVESQINIRLEQLKLLEPQLNEEEKQRSTALELYLNDQKTALEEQKSVAKGFQNDKLDAITKGMPVAVAQQVQELFDAGQVDQAYSVLGGYMRTPTSTAASSVLTKAQKTALGAAGVPSNLSDEITQAILGGAELEDIRQALKADGMDTKILDTYDRIVSIAGLLASTKFKSGAGGLSFENL